MTCPPSSSAWVMAWRSDSLSPPTTVFSLRMSMISTAGIGRSPTRLGIASRVYRPRSALRQLSSDGVAEPRITGIAFHLRHA